MDYLIVGAGIAGLYTAYELCKNHVIKNILIVERNDYIGGRIKTLHLKKNNITVELGAGVISQDHKHMLKLVNELGLSNDLVFSKSVKYAINNETGKITNVNKSGFREKILELKNNMDKKNACSYTLYRYIERIYGIKVANELTNQFGYPADFYEQNAVDGINMLLRDSDKGYYRLKNGLDQIIHRLEDYLKSNNVEIKLGVSLINIKKVKNKYECLLSNGYIIANSVVLAIPKEALCNIEYLNPIRDSLLNSVVSKALMRIYMIFPTENLWFESLKGITVTNTLLNQIIPINKEKGVLMVYLIGENATSMEMLKEKGLMEEEVMFHLRKLFKNVGNPSKIYSVFWKEATHMFINGVNSEVIGQKIMKPFDEDKVYVVGESYSMIQQWSEGCISDIQKLMHIIK